MAKLTEERRQERDRALKYIEGNLAVKARIYTIVTHYTEHNSCIVLLVAGNNGEIEDITYFVARILGSRMSVRHKGLIHGGVQSDRAFDVVDSLNHRIHHLDRSRYFQQCRI